MRSPRFYRQATKLNRQNSSKIYKKQIMADKRESTRVKDQRKVLDDVARKRRAKKAIESLEQDNFHDDPHANLVMHKKAPKFEESFESKRRSRKLKTEPFKQRFRRNFSALLEEEQSIFLEKYNYQMACVPPSKFPERHFCSVCGFASNYTCVQCGARFCCIKCLKTHQDTRCLKWTA